MLSAAATYPPRVAVPETQRAWAVDWPEYAPVDHTDASVLRASAEGRADPVDPRTITRTLTSFTGPLVRDRAGRPLNPTGRSGVAGRGLLWRWGPNHAADAIIFRPDKGPLGAALLAIRRRDTGLLAIPGGMIDFGEDPRAAMQRELAEETGVSVDLSTAPIIFQGYAADPRNTDHAWTETTAGSLWLTAKHAASLEPQGGDDASAAMWVSLDDPTLDGMYGIHAQLVRLALARPRPDSAQ